MADPQDPLTQLSLTSFSQSFIIGATGELLHRSDRPVCFLPTSLSCEAGEWVWSTNAYATVSDTPVTDELLDAARVVVRDNLEKQIVLPPKMKMIRADHLLWPEWYVTFITKFVKFNAIYKRWVEAEYEKSEDLADYSATMEALENWRKTCDALAVCPKFSSNWEVPAFVSVYGMCCYGACLDYFEDQKEHFPWKKKDFWDGYLNEAVAVFGEWQHMFDNFTSPKFIAFPKCLWYHRYFYQHVKEQPGFWRKFFEGTLFNDRGAIAMSKLATSGMALGLPTGLPTGGGGRFTVDSPLTINSDVNSDMSGFVTQT